MQLILKDIFLTHYCRCVLYSFSYEHLLFQCFSNILIIYLLKTQKVFEDNLFCISLDE